ncbi:MAG: hypothetical protein ABFR62_10580 [Bacteroidota bacterium]
MRWLRYLLKIIMKLLWKLFRKKYKEEDVEEDLSGIRLLIISFVSIITGIVLTLVYFYRFHGKISSDLNVWNTFSSYFTLVAIMFFGAFIMLLLYYISVGQKETPKIILRSQLIFEEYKSFNRELSPHKLMYSDSLNSAKSIFGKLTDSNLYEIEYNSLLKELLQAIGDISNSGKLIWLKLESFEKENELLLNLKPGNLETMGELSSFYTDVLRNLNKGDETVYLGAPLKTSKDENIRQLQEFFEKSDLFSESYKSEIQSLQQHILGSRL